MILPINLALPAAPASHVAAVRCTVPGCLNSTREAKPWCSDHVPGHSPLVLDELAELEAREAEVRTGRVRVEGSLAQDVLQLIGSGQASTVGMIARQLVDFPTSAVASRYVRRLVRLGLVDLRRSRRYREVEGVMLTEAGWEALGAIG